MNIFVLDQDPVRAAQMQCDRHVIKMVLETAQLLCSAFPAGTAPYKRTHYNHPCAVWTRQTAGNYFWLADHGLALADEYEHRYGKVHASRSAILWCLNNFILAAVDHSGERTPFAQAMPDAYRNDDPVAAYRAYYRGAKAAIASWKPIRGQPEWWAV